MSNLERAALNQVLMKLSNPSTVKAVKMNPTTAMALAEDKAVRDFIVSSPKVLAQIQGREPSENGVWGLPDQIGPVKLIVDDSVEGDTNLKYSFPDGVFAA